MQKSKAKVAVKSLSWAAVSGVIIGTTAYVQTGLVGASIITALVSAMLKTPVYSLHEVLFDLAWHRKERRQASGEPILRVVDDEVA